MASICTRPLTARPAAAAVAGTKQMPSRVAVITKSSSAGAVLGATAAVLMVVSPAAWANDNQYEESTAYQREMVELIQARSKGKAVLEVDVKSMETAAPALIEEAPIMKVEASMTPEERSEAIRAEAIRSATADSSSQVVRTRAGASLSNRNAGSSSGNPGAALLGVVVVAAAVGGAYYYQNMGTAQAAAGTVSGTPQPATPADTPTTEREQSPAPSA